MIVIKKNDPAKAVKARPKKEERNTNGTFKAGNTVQSANGHTNKKKRDKERSTKILNIR